MTNLTPETCPNHKPVQHRDMKPPWCNTCGWTRHQPEIAPVQITIPKEKSDE